MVHVIASDAYFVLVLVLVPEYSFEVLAVVLVLELRVAGSNPGRRAAVCNSGQVVYTRVPMSSSSIIWCHQPTAGDARRLGR